MFFHILTVACVALASQGRRVQLTRAGKPRSHQLPTLDDLHSSREALATVLLGFNPAGGWHAAGHSCGFARNNLNSDPAGRCTELQMMPPFAVDDPALPAHGTIQIPLDQVLQEARLEKPVEPRSPVKQLEKFFKACRKVVQVCAAACTTSTALQAGVISGAADVMVQSIGGSVQTQGFDFLRTLSFMLFGNFYCGAFQPSVYRRFDRWFGDNLPLKLLVEFLVYLPLIYIPSFYMITGMVQGLGCSGSFAKLVLTYWVSLKSDILIWGIPMIVYFRWVPVRKRVLYLSTLGMIERVVFSFLGQQR